MTATMTMPTYDVDLDSIFRGGSKARRVAEILLDGLPHTRQQLAEDADVSPTTVPRVIGLLEDKGGVTIKAEVDDTGRGSVYRVVRGKTRQTSGAPLATYVPKGTPLELTITGFELVSGQVVVATHGRKWYVIGDVHFSAETISEPQAVRAIRFLGDGTIAVTLPGGVELALIE